MSNLNMQSPFEDFEDGVCIGEDALAPYWSYIGVSMTLEEYLRSFGPIENPEDGSFDYGAIVNEA